MALRDFVLPTLEVPLSDGSSFAVRGISLQDVTLLLTEYGEEMDGFYQQMSGQPQQSAMAVGMSLVAKAPGLVSKVIALAADEPDMADKIMKLPLAIQQVALEKIAKLTFDASGGPGKFIEAVKMLVRSTGSLSKLQL